ncbi:MAG: hypothetical protein LUC35_04655, partial [Clostridiales bacterium]|nr:hypothetical protein [Clostridiales bacterium]
MVVLFRHLCYIIGEGTLAPRNIRAQEDETITTKPKGDGKMNTTKVMIADADEEFRTLLGEMIDRE